MKTRQFKGFPEFRLISIPPKTSLSQMVAAAGYGWMSSITTMTHLLEQRAASKQHSVTCCSCPKIGKSTAHPRQSRNGSNAIICSVERRLLDLF